MLRERQRALPHDVYFVMTAEEERGGVGASYAARILPGDITIALEVGPVSKEYGVVLSADPIIVYGDSCGLHSKLLADRLANQAKLLGHNPQRAVWENFGSDASISKSYGQSAQIGLISIPTLNTHGFEIIRRESLKTCADLLFAFLQAPAHP